MLDTLIYSDKTSEERESILKDVYNIPISRSIKEEINTMCNLGEGIYEKAIAEEQARQAIVIQQLLEEKTKALLKAGVPQDIIDKVMKQ